MSEFEGVPEQRPDRVISLAGDTPPDALVSLEFTVSGVPGEFVELSWFPADRSLVLSFRMTDRARGADIDMFVQGAARMMADGMDAMQEMLEEQERRG